MTYYRDVFKNNSEEDLMRAVKNGLDVYTENDGNEHGKKMTFYEAAIAWGTPELVKACIETGAEVDRSNITQNRSSLHTALVYTNVRTLRALLEAGACVDADELNWELRKNFFPEAERDEKAVAFRHKLDVGSEILKLLRDAGYCVPGGDDPEMSYYHVSSKSRRELEEMEGEYLFPLPGGDAPGLWNAASKGALELMIESGADMDARDSDGWTALHHLLCRYHEDDYYFESWDMIRCLIESGANINARGRYGMTPLMMAAVNIRYNPEYIETVKFLIRKGADFDLTDENGHNALYWAADYWYIGLYAKWSLKEVIKEINRATLPPEDIDLMTAALYATPDRIEPALSCCKNMNAQSENGYTPLMFSSIWNYAPTTQFLIDRGASIDAQNARGETALTLAIQTTDYPMIHTLADAGANLAVKDNDGQTALMHVADKGYSSICVARALIEAGADINARDNKGRTTLELAMNENCGYEFVKFLLDSGADPKPMNRSDATELGEEDEITAELLKYGLKPRANFSDAFADNDAEAIVTAIKNGINLRVCDKDDKPFWKAALSYGDSLAVQACIDRGMDPNEVWEGEGIITFKSFPESCPLYIAIEAYNADAVKTLLEAGANPRSVLRSSFLRLRNNIFPDELGRDKSDGDSQLLTELKKKLDTGEEILRVLGEAGADIPKGESLTYVSINAYHKDGGRYENDEDPAIKLRRAISPGALKLLIDDKIDVNAKGDDGMTALHCFAVKWGEYFNTEAMIKLLVEAGADVNVRNNDGVTPLMYLSDGVTRHPRSWESIKLLAMSGADFDAEDNDGLTAENWLMVPEHNAFGIMTMEDLLMVSEHNAFMTMRKELLGAVRNAFTGEIDAREKANINLMTVACWGSVPQIESVMSRGADVNAAIDGGHTPLMFASVYNTKEAVQFLIEKGADINARSAMRKDTALMLAIRSGRSDIETVRALVEAGSNVNAANYDGDTPLIMAANTCKTDEIVKILIKTGADVDAQNHGGKSAATIALKKLHFQTVKTLLVSGASLASDEVKTEEPDAKNDDKGTQDTTAATLLRYGLNV